MTREIKNLTADGVMHVVFAGIRFDLSLAGLAISAATDDDGVKRALAGRLSVPISRFDDHVVERDGDGNLTIQPDPEIVFG